MMEAQNLQNLTIAQTPLLGDENTPLHTGPGGGFDSATPWQQVAFTPNPLVTPWQQGSIGIPGSVSATPLWTPLHDMLSINPGDMTPRNDPRDQQLSSVSDKQALKAGFMEQDASDRDEKLKWAQQGEELRVLNRRSWVVKLGIPRPINMDMTLLMQNLSLEVLNLELTHAQEPVNAELMKLVHHDSVKYPLPGTTRAGTLEFLYHVDYKSFSFLKENETALGPCRVASFIRRWKSRSGRKAFCRCNMQNCSQRRRNLKRGSQLIYVPEKMQR